MELSPRLLWQPHWSYIFFLKWGSIQPPLWLLLEHINVVEFAIHCFLPLLLSYIMSAVTL